MISLNTTEPLIVLLNVQSPAPSFWPEKLITEDILQAYYAAEGAKILQAAEQPVA